jgi:enamine deaminase RidA (YjgF/YER057c/UK114 family)
MSAEARLKELGFVLPALPNPVANYLPYRVAGNLLFLAGQGPRDEKGAALTGKVGAEISIDEGYRRAHLVGLGLLAAIRDALGSLDRVDFIVKLLGMVNAVPNFNDSPRVINGCSDLFVEVFGEAGRHARSAVGNVMLPNQIRSRSRASSRSKRKPRAHPVTPNRFASHTPAHAGIPIVICYVVLSDFMDLSQLGLVSVLAFVSKIEALHVAPIAKGQNNAACHRKALFRPIRAAKSDAC